MRVINTYSESFMGNVDVSLLPIASFEHHGVLPPTSDLLIAECVIRKLEDELKKIKDEKVVAMLPPLPFSISYEHDYPRISISPKTFIELLSDIMLEALVFSRALVVPVFHGGAFHAVYTAARWVRSRSGKVVAVYSFWESVESIVSRLDVSGKVFHADPIEASILAACNHKGLWARDASLEEILKVVKACRVKPRIHPWMASDFERFYPEKLVPASYELGVMILNESVKRLVETITAVLEFGRE